MHGTGFFKGGSRAWALDSIEVGQRMGTGFCKDGPGAWELVSVSCAHTHGLLFL